MIPHQKLPVRFGISFLLVVTAVFAGMMRLTQNPHPIEISFDDLELDSTLGSLGKQPTLPASIKNLDQAKVWIRGYIAPHSVFRERGIRNFLLCRDPQEPPENVSDDDFVIVRMVEGAEAKFVTRPVVVTGQFKILEPPLITSDACFYYEIVAFACD